MHYVFSGVTEAFRLLFTFNAQVYQSALLSLEISSISTLFACLIGLPIGLSIGLNNFPGKRFVIMFFNALYSIPTVIIGLFVYSLICRQGPFGFLNLLYTPFAMILGQFLLILPLIIALSIAATRSVDARVIKTALTLGANYRQFIITVLREGKVSYLAAALLGFGRAFGEIGVSMMLGGNIRGYTRNITTTIALETSKGEFALGIAMGIILLVIAFIISSIIQYLQTLKQDAALRT